jgi:hypothetical protein
MALLVNRLSCSPTDEGSCTVIRRRFNALDCFAYMVRDQEVSHSVPLVPVGRSGWLQRIEDIALFKYLSFRLIPPLSILLHIDTLGGCSQRRFGWQINFRFVRDPHEDDGNSR